MNCIKNNIFELGLLAQYANNYCNENDGSADSIEWARYFVQRMVPIVEQLEKMH